MWLSDRSNQGRSCFQRARPKLWKRRSIIRETLRNENDIPAPRERINNAILEFILIEKYSGRESRAIYWWYSPGVREATGALICSESVSARGPHFLKSWDKPPLRRNIFSNVFTFFVWNLRPSVCKQRDEGKDDDDDDDDSRIRHREHHKKRNTHTYSSMYFDLGRRAKREWMRREREKEQLTRVCLQKREAISVGSHVQRTGQSRNQ